MAFRACLINAAQALPHCAEAPELAKAEKEKSLLCLISVAHLVELTPDSFGLPFLIDVLLCFIPGSGLSETSATTTLGLHGCLL